jgi:hypothetical protein
MMILVAVIGIRWELMTTAGYLYGSVTSLAADTQAPVPSGWSQPCHDLAQLARHGRSFPARHLRHDLLAQAPC